MQVLRGTSFVLKRVRSNSIGSEGSKRQRVVEEESKEQEAEAIHNRKEVPGHVAQHLHDDLARLIGSIRVARGQLVQTVEATCCSLCESKFASNKEQMRACHNLYLKIEFLKVKEKQLHQAVDSLERQGLLEKNASFKVCNGKLCESLKDKPHVRLGFINYFRSLRAEGIKNKACPVCGKKVADVAKFLSTLDRLSYLAGKRFFDSSESEGSHWPLQQ